MANQNPQGQPLMMTAQDIQTMIDNTVNAVLSAQNTQAIPVQQPQQYVQTQPVYQTAPSQPQPMIINPPAPQGIDANTMAKIIQLILQNGGNPYAIDWGNVSPMVKNAVANYVNYGNPCMTQEQVMQLLLNETRETRYAIEAREQKKSSTKHKVLKYTGMGVAGLALVAGVGYVAHEVIHRHDEDKKLSALSHFGDSFLAAKYGNKDII